MINKQTNRSTKARQPKSIEQFKQSKDITSLKSGSPMDKFNNAMRKILSVSKKDINKK